MPRNRTRPPTTRAALLLTAAALVSPTLVTAASAATTVPASLTAESPRLRARDGGGIEVFTRLSTASADDTGHRVVLQLRAPGSTTWEDSSTSTTGGSPRQRTDGRASWSVRSLSSDYSFRVLHPAQTVRGTSYGRAVSRVLTTAVGGPRTFTVADNGRDRAMRFDLIPGDKVVFTAEECRSCGYSWTVTRDTDARLVAKTVDTYSEPERDTQQDEPPVVGGPGTHRYAWSARAAAGPSTPGRTSTTLDYQPGSAGREAGHTVTAAFNVFP